MFFLVLQVTRHFLICHFRSVFVRGDTWIRTVELLWVAVWDINGCEMWRHTVDSSKMRHRLRYRKPETLVKLDSLHINWSRISSINSITVYHGYPSLQSWMVSLVDLDFDSPRDLPKLRDENSILLVESARCVWKILSFYSSFTHFYFCCNWPSKS